MNSREKGKRGEREFAGLLRRHGFNARRGQQFAGGEDSPDVISPDLRWLHIEVKRDERLNIEKAMEQAQRDCHLTPTLSPKGGEGEEHRRQKVPIVAHRRNHAPWLITMRAEFFFQLVQEFQPRICTDETRSRGAAAEGEDRQEACPTLGIRPEAWVKTEDGGRMAEDGWRMADGGGRRTEDEREN